MVLVASHGSPFIELKTFLYILGPWRNIPALIILTFGIIKRALLTKCCHHYIAYRRVLAIICFGIVSVLIHGVATEIYLGSSKCQERSRSRCIVENNKRGHQ